MRLYDYMKRKKGGNIKNTIGFSVKTGIKMFEAMIRDF